MGECVRETVPLYHCATHSPTHSLCLSLTHSRHSLTTARSGFFRHGIWNLEFANLEFANLELEWELFAAKRSWVVASDVSNLLWACVVH